jgi:protein-S-isoprenylcysteine O-methyltransferase Ste14
MEIIGATPINPFVFYTGKLAGYLAWVFIVLKYFGVDIAGAKYELLAISAVFFVPAILLILLSLVFLGRSVRLGLPSADTSLKSKGIYRASRNPMYLGFDLLTVASIIGTANIPVALLGIYSIITYHLIIRAEERFLEQRFGDRYREYKGKVNRYLGWRGGSKGGKPWTR